MQGERVTKWVLCEHASEKQDPKNSPNWLKKSTPCSKKNEQAWTSKMLIGYRWRQIRKEKGISLGDIEKRTGLRQDYISDVESGRTLPYVESLESFARALDVSIDQLFYDGENPPRLLNLPKRLAACTETGDGTKKEVRWLAKLQCVLGRVKERDKDQAILMVRMMTQSKAKN